MATLKGRPFKQHVPGQRYSISFKVDASIKRKLETEARATGRTQSQICEQLISQGLRDRWIMEQMKRIWGMTTSKPRTQPIGNGTTTSGIARRKRISAPARN